MSMLLYDPVSNPPFGSEGAGSQRGDWWRSAVHMQLFPPLLMQGVLHCNPLPLETVYAKKLTEITMQTHTRVGISMHGRQCTKITNLCIPLFHSTLLYSLFCHRVTESVSVFPKKTLNQRRAGLKRETNFCGLSTLYCLWLGRHKAIDLVPGSLSRV